MERLLRVNVLYATMLMCVACSRMGWLMRIAEATLSYGTSAAVETCGWALADQLASRETLERKATALIKKTGSRHVW